MVYSKEDAEAAVSRANEGAVQGRGSAKLAEEQLRALAEISEQLNILNKAFGKHGLLGEPVMQLQRR